MPSTPSIARMAAGSINSPNSPARYLMPTVTSSFPQSRLTATAATSRSEKTSMFQTREAFLPFLAMFGLSRLLPNNSFKPSSLRGAA